MRYTRRPSASLVSTRTRGSKEGLVPEVTCSNIGRERAVPSLASRISGGESMGFFVDADCPCRRKGGVGSSFVVLMAVICVHFIL
jgi:hypothetical protein